MSCQPRSANADGERDWIREPKTDSLREGVWSFREKREKGSEENCSFHLLSEQKLPGNTLPLRVCQCFVRS